MANEHGRDRTDVGLRQHSAYPLEHTAGGDLEKKYETSDVNLRPIVTTVVVLAAITVVSYIVVYGLYVYWQSSDAETRTQNVLPIAEGFEQPRTGPLLVEGEESPDLARMKAESAKRVDSYGWVDPNAGVAHIPVERAMDIVAEKGLPSGAPWELAPDEVIVQGVIRKAAEINAPPAAGSVLPAQPTQNVPGGMVPGQPNSGAGQPATAVPTTGNPGGANPGEGVAPMHSGFGGPSQGGQANQRRGSQ
jgi:hypothetical protein